jgi:hypothetical protein
MPRHPDLLIERLSQPAAAAMITASGTAVAAVAFDALARREAIRPIITM